MKSADVLTVRFSIEVVSRVAQAFAFKQTFEMNVER